MRRQELETWLKTIDVEARSVVDVGGIALPVRNRCKSWNVDDYKIVDLKGERKGVKTDLICDLNERHVTILLEERFDVAFCLELMQFVYRPFKVLKNIYILLKPGGTLYISFHLTHPPMKGTDYLRYTKLGVQKLLTETGFVIQDLQGEDYFFVTAIKYED